MSMQTPFLASRAMSRRTASHRIGVRIRRSRTRSPRSCWTTRVLTSATISARATSISMTRVPVASEVTEEAEEAEAETMPRKMAVGVAPMIVGDEVAEVAVEAADVEVLICKLMKKLSLRRGSMAACNQNFQSKTPPCPQYRQCLQLGWCSTDLPRTSKNLHASTNSSTSISSRATRLANSAMKPTLLLRVSNTRCTTQ